MEIYITGGSGRT